MKPTTRGIWDLISTTVVAVSAVTMLLVYLHDRNQAGGASQAEASTIEDWLEWSESGIRMGPDGATRWLQRSRILTVPTAGISSLSWTPSLRSTQVTWQSSTTPTR